MLFFFLLILVYNTCSNFGYSWSIFWHSIIFLFKKYCLIGALLKSIYFLTMQLVLLICSQESKATTQSPLQVCSRKHKDFWIQSISITLNTYILIMCTLQIVLYFVHNLIMEPISLSYKA